eukprot:scaffold1192_cov206-Alexandrium_tamarense.AAC.12
MSVLALLLVSFILGVTLVASVLLPALYDDSTIDNNNDKEALLYSLLKETMKKACQSITLNDLVSQSTALVWFTLHIVLSTVLWQVTARRRSTQAKSMPRGRTSPPVGAALPLVRYGSPLPTHRSTQ